MSNPITRQVFISLSNDSKAYAYWVKVCECLRDASLLANLREEYDIDPTSNDRQAKIDILAAMLDKHFEEELHKLELPCPFSSLLQSAFNEVSWFDVSTEVLFDNGVIE